MSLTTEVLEGEMLNYDMMFCPRCDYRTGVGGWSSPEYGVKSARAALVSHLCRKRHQMARADARVLADQQPVIKAGTVIKRPLADRSPVPGAPK